MKILNCKTMNNTIKFLTYKFFYIHNKFNYILLFNSRIDVNNKACKNL